MIKGILTFIGSLMMAAGIIAWSGYSRPPEGIAMMLGVCAGMIIICGFLLMVHFKDGGKLSDLL